MKSRWLIAVILLAVAGFSAWAFWQRPEPVVMASYIPAETLVYLEVNDLPLVLKSLTGTDAWHELAPKYGVERNFGEVGWLSQTLARINLGSTANVVFGRSQIAVALLGIEISAAQESLKIKPRYAVVIETKTSQTRARDFAENQIGDFAKRQFGEASAEKLDRNGTAWMIFRSTKDERKLFAAVSGSVVVTGNDEAAVQSCLDVKSRKRQSLAENPGLAEMRGRTDAEKGFAFGLVTPEGVKKLAQIGAVIFAGQVAEDPVSASLIVQSLPPLFEKSITSLGWSARAAQGKIEDRYFAAMPGDLVARLKEPLTVGNQTKYIAADFLPGEVHSVTIYNLKNAGTAWRGLIFALTTRLDALSAAAFTQTANRLLEPYGVNNAIEFLNQTSGELTTARLSRAENETVAIIGIGNEEKLKATVEPALKKSKRAAAFIGETLLLGEKDDVEKCAAGLNGENWKKTESGRKFSETKLFEDPPIVKSFTRDDESAARFVKLFARQKNSSDEAVNNQAFAVSETRLSNGGFERRTRSDFGLIGMLAANFAGE